MSMQHGTNKSRLTGRSYRKRKKMDFLLITVIRAKICSDLDLLASRRGGKAQTVRKGLH